MCTLAKKNKNENKKLCCLFACGGFVAYMVLPSTLKEFFSCAGHFI